MNLFLKQLATYYYNTYQTKISDFCFVFPGRRAGLFFKEHLKTLLNSPILAPKTLTINEFIHSFSDFKVADKLTLVFELYQVYENIYQTGVSFDDFLPWGEIILNDFDDIDKYRADAKQVYSNLLAIKEIEDDYSFLSEEQIKTIKSFWESFNPNKLSEHQTEFISIWKKLDEVYEQFNAQIKEKGFTYEGQVYKSIADKIDKKEPLNITYSKTIFVSFNALNRCEEKLFNHLKITDKADFIWDYNPDLLPDFSPNKNIHNTKSLHEAMLFMVDNINNFPPPSDWQLPTPECMGKIKITSVASSTSQTQVVQKFLSQIESDTENHILKATQTAIVLTDENMLLPVLHSIPENEKLINITMGYPLKNTPIYALVELIFDLQKNSRTTKQGKTWFYFRNVLPILTHQYIEPLDSDLHKKITHDLISKNRTYIEANELHQSPLLKRLFVHIEKSTQISTYLSELLMVIHQSFTKNENASNALECEFIYQTYLLINHINDLLATINTEITNDTWAKLYKRSAEMHSIPFSGEPLKGLQIMGIMETRALDFENLIILNMNEGVFPQTGATNSLIPYILRKAFKLPTIEHQDAIFAYYFYRLIHRAKNIHLLYNSSSQGMQSGEMSRFLYQLKYEYPIKPTFSTISESVNLSFTPEFYVEKNNQVMSKLEQYLKPDGKKLSPSALSTYFECPIRFYYKYVINTKEPDEVSEDIDPRIFGTLFHETLEVLYQDFIGKNVVEQDIAQLIKNKSKVDEILQQTFEKHFNQSIYHSDFKDIQGQNILIFDIIKKYIFQFLNTEKQLTPFTLLGLEKKVEAAFPIGDKTVYLGGTIDRLDEKDKNIRVIDYKTGSGEDKINKVEDLFKQEKHKKVKAIFQTLLYSSILKQNENALQNYIPGVIWVKKIFTSSDYTLKIAPPRTKAQTLHLSLVEEEYSEQLKQHLNDLFNPDIAFTQTTHPDNCKSCSYAGICSKVN